MPDNSRGLDDHGARRSPALRRRRRRDRLRGTAVRAGIVGLVAGLLAVPVALPVAGPAAAQVVAHPGVVSDNPANVTPNVLDGKVNAFAQVGSLIVAGGSFSQVQAATGGPVLNRSNIFAFDAVTGVISTSFAPTVSGQVFDLEPTVDGSAVYVSGGFTQVNGSGSSRLALLSVATGQKVPGFSVPTISSTVKNVHLVGSRLLIGGSFATVGGQPRTALASLDASTGALTSFLSISVAAPINGGVVQALKTDVTPDGRRLVMVGNFTQVAGQPRSLLALVDLTGASATLADWATGFYTDSCADVFDTYMRDVDFSPDGSYFVVTTTGAYGGPTSPCDVIARWETDASGSGLEATWLDYTGGDTTYAVAVTGAAVYVGGHMRWMNNPYAGDVAGPGAVPREGIAALDPTSGLPLSWNPGRARGVGVFDLLATPQGLWVGSDTDRIGGETRRKVAFFPLAGGTTLPPETLGRVPNDVYLLGRSGAGGSDPGVLYRVNAGGPPLQSADDGPDWEGDTDPTSPYRNGGSNSALWDGTGAVHSSVPAALTDRAPAALFASERWDPGDGQEMQWEFPVPAGTAVTVRVYLSNRCGCTSGVGTRVFDLSVDGVVLRDNLDLVAVYGNQVGAMIATDIESDGTIDIDFGHVVENPLVNGIEIVTTGSQGGGGGGPTVADEARSRSFDGTSGGPESPLSTTVPWGLSRGAFMVDGTLYAAFADGTLTRRAFDGTSFGPSTVVPMYGGSFAADIPNLTGSVYSQGRIYYTMFGSSALHWRWFSPESHVVGATPYQVGGSVGALAPADVRGLFLSGTTLYAVDRTSGELRRVSLAGTTVTGPAVPLSTGIDWRARSIVLWNGTPTGPNADPVAVAAGSCPAVGLTCSFDASASNDDGTITSYVWDFGDGSTSTLVAPSHTYGDAGPRTVTLTVTDDRGASDTDTVQVDPVAPPNEDPTAVITSSCAGLTCTFSGSSSTDDGTITSYAWDFGGGDVGSGVSVQRTFPAAGTYPVSLTVTDDDGATDTSDESVTVEDAPPVTIDFRGRGTAAGNVTSIAVPSAAGQEPGDTLLMFVTSAQGTLPTATPAGWTFVADQIDSADLRTALYRRSAPAGGALGTLGWSSRTKVAVVVLAYSGADPVPAAVASQAKTTASSTSYPSPAAATSEAGSWVISFWSLRASAVPTWTAPSGASARADAAATGNGLVAGFAADTGPVTVGTVPSASATASVASAKATGWTVVLGPA